MGIFLIKKSEQEGKKKKKDNRIFLQTGFTNFTSRSPS